MLKNEPKRETPSPQFIPQQQVLTSEAHLQSCRDTRFLTIKYKEPGIDSLQQLRILAERTMRIGNLLQERSCSVVIFTQSSTDSCSQSLDPALNKTPNLPNEGLFPDFFSFTMNPSLLPSSPKQRHVPLFYLCSQYHSGLWLQITETNIDQLSRKKIVASLLSPQRLTKRHTHRELHSKNVQEFEATVKVTSQEQAGQGAAASQLDTGHQTRPPVPLTTTTACGHCWNQWQNKFTVPVFFNHFFFIKKQALIAEVWSMQEKYLGFWALLEGVWVLPPPRFSQEVVQMLAGSVKDEPRQTNPDVLMSETWLCLGVDPCQLHKSLAH